MRLLYDGEVEAIRKTLQKIRRCEVLQDTEEIIFILNYYHMKSLTLLLIPLLFLLPNITFASTTKNSACSYKEWIYQEVLETTWLKRATVEEFQKRDYYDHSELWYIVRQSNMYTIWSHPYDDYSTYSYNCKTRRATRGIWQLTFRDILQKIPQNTTYTNARIAFIGGESIDIRWYSDLHCRVETCDSDFFVSSIHYSPHTFSIGKRMSERGPNKYDRIGSFVYSH